MKIKDKVSVVVPSKNEVYNLYQCICYIANQIGIEGTKVIIADVSDDELSLRYLNNAIIDFGDILNIEIIEGGYPAQGRLNGSKLVKTPYLLFLDSDIMLTNRRIMNDILQYDVDLVTVPFITKPTYDWVFRLFDLFQWLSTKLGTPFAVGGFQLWKTETYWKLGGYNPEELFAEDYSLSQKVNSKNFKIHKTEYVYTSPRRFKKKGVLWMFKIMIKSYINRNNPEFFKEHHGYWN
jgi:glycosyltransferase involved in cell wall biosynthesis